MDASHTVGQPRVLISREAILRNIKLIRSRLRRGTQVCAMVKADAYGHGAALVADTLTNFSYDGIEAPAVDALAVVTLQEAQALGESVVPVIVLRPVESIQIDRERDRLVSAIRGGTVLTVTSLSAIGDLSRLATACGRRADIQIMIDTGQSREGAPPGSLGTLVAAIEAQPSLRLASLATHFACSEEKDNPFNATQLSRFHAATDRFGTPARKLLRHAANSGAIFFAPAAHLDMVRPGISIFGIDPTCQPSLDRPLRPALKWIAPLTMIRDLRKGETVGYNQTWTAPRDSRIGLVPVGYADGYQRAFSNRARMVLHGVAAPVIGRVSMDYTTIDLTDVPRAALGDEVTVLDCDPLSPASVYALAALAQTIPYEVFCHVGPRMPRLAAEDTSAAVRTTAYRMRLQKQAV